MNISYFHTHHQRNTNNLFDFNASQMNENVKKCDVESNCKRQNAMLKASSTKLKHIYNKLFLIDFNM